MRVYTQGIRRGPLLGIAVVLTLWGVLMFGLAVFSGLTLRLEQSDNCVSCGPGVMDNRGHTVFDLASAA